MTYQWSDFWEDTGVMGTLFPNAYNEIRYSILERAYASTYYESGINNLQNSMYNIDAGDWISSDWFDDIKNTVSGLCEYYENYTIAGTQKWTEFGLENHIGPMINDPNDAQISAQYLTQIYKAINAYRTPIEYPLYPAGPSYVGYRTKRITIDEPDLVADYAEWDIYNGDIKIDGTVYTTGNSYTLWTNDERKRIYDPNYGDVTGNAKTMVINVYSASGSSPNTYSMCNTFKDYAMYQNWR